jgi:Fic family protein
MNDLFNFVKQEMATYSNIQSAPEAMRKTLILGALFFSEFLRIHLFSNGNGRTARLLLNVLLKDSTIIPFSLYYRGKIAPRETYIGALENRSDGTPPNLVALLVLLTAYGCVESLSYLL